MTCIEKKFVVVNVFDTEEGMTESRVGSLALGRVPGCDGHEIGVLGV